MTISWQESVEYLLESLAHTLWQGLFWALLSAVALRLLPAARAGLRCALCGVALALVVIGWPVTWAIIAHEPAPPAPVPVETRRIPDVTAVKGDTVAQPVVMNSPEETAHRQGSPASVQETAAPAAPWRFWLASLWATGVLLLFLRSFLALRGVRRIVHGSSRPDEDLMRWLCHHLPSLQRKMGLDRRVAIRISPLLTGPAVSGLLRPVILLPAEVVSGVPRDYLAAMLAHELAHIRRHDYLINLLQMAAENLLFFNPAIWWISRQMRIEREACCDALAVQATGQPLNYARALTDLAETQNRDNAETDPLLNPSPAMPMRGEGQTRGSLYDRIRRLLVPAERPQLRLGWPAALAVMLAVFTTLSLVRLGAEVAVRALSPEERIAKIDELHEHYPQPEVQEVLERNAPETEGEPTKLSVSGQVLLPSGQPLDRKARLILFREKSNHSQVIANSFNDQGRLGNDDPGVIVWDDIPAGSHVALGVELEGLAPVFWESPRVDDDIAGITLQLEEGYQSILRFETEDGEPLSNVRLKARYSGNPSPRMINKESGESAEIPLEHLTERPLDITAWVEGFERGDWKEILLEPGGSRVLPLIPTVPTEIRITDAQTGEPIPQATISPFIELRSHHSHNLGHTQKPIATADDDGLAVLNTLRADRSSTFLVRAEGFLTEMTPLLEPGKNLDVALRRSFPVDLIVRGLPDKAFGWRDKPNVRLEITHEAEKPGGGGFSSGWTDQLEDYVTYQDTEAGEVHFHFDPFYAVEEQTLLLGDLKYPTSLEELRALDGPLVLDYEDLLAQEEQPPTGELRTVRIELISPEGLPPVQGTVIADYIKGGDLDIPGYKRYAESKIVEIRDGVGKLEIPLPNDLGLSPEGLRGYWFDPPFFSEELLADTSDPIVMRFDAVPAGAIAFTTKRADGQPVTGILPGIELLEDSPVREKMSSTSLHVKVKDMVSSDDRQSKFLASPLPFGGRYVIKASSGASFVFSKPLEINEETPLHEITLTIPELVKVTGQVFAPDGSPLRNVQITLGIDLANGIETGSSSGITTDHNGVFVVPNLNPQLDGITWIEIDNPPGALPLRREARFDGKPLIFQLERGYVVEGVVKVAGTELVVPGAEVYATRHFDHYREYDADAWPSWFDAPLTDENGRFQIHLPPGEFKIGCRSGSFPEGYNPPVIEAGAEETVVVAIQPYEWEELTPVEPQSH